MQHSTDLPPVSKSEATQSNLTRGHHYRFCLPDLSCLYPGGIRLACCHLSETDHLTPATKQLLRALSFAHMLVWDENIGQRSLRATREEQIGSSVIYLPELRAVKILYPSPLGTVKCQ